MSETRISYDGHLRLATFTGPGGFTQVAMGQAEARAIADVLDIALTLRRCEANA